MSPPANNAAQAASVTIDRRDTAFGWHRNPLERENAAAVEQDGFGDRPEQILGA
jgi:hypothetical protein